MYKLALLFALPAITMAYGGFRDAAEAFHLMVDYDGDRNVLRSESQPFFQSLDCNRDRIVDYEEYLVVVEGKPVFEGYEFQVFSYIDFDKDGRLTLYDFENDFVYFDTNKDDAVSTEEFLAKIYY